MNEAGNGGRTGVERAAILLLTLGESEAAEILKHLGAKDVQRLGRSMAELSNVSRDEVRHVLGDFTSAVEMQTSLGVGTDEFIRKVLVNALGEEKAASLMERISLGGTRKGLDALKWMDSRQVAELIRNEHPQIVAIVLSYLEAEQSAEVLGCLPDGMRTDLIMRVAMLDGIQPTALQELDEMMEKRFAAGGNAGTSSALGGLRVAAEMLNLLDSKVGTSIMDAIGKTDEGLSQKIQDLMFVFDDLLEIDDRGMQELLRQVPADKLLIALKGADDTFKAKVFKNMSQRAAEMLKSDLEAKGPVRLSDVEAAQKEILLAARKLSDEGTISLGGKGEQYV
ncbi:MAG TPA: flagellar motor switch protein FliG [Steroidobacteraceae bacterium]|jgi:flagellar motor switch protein FliG|nr:flagellar motor switch protein FliG [Steroidobacteraceae bacterium]